MTNVDCDVKQQINQIKHDILKDISTCNKVGRNGL